MSLLGLNKAIFDQVDARRADVVLYELHEKTDTIVGNPLAFQYFPETLTDTKAVNYQQKEIPGGSLPLYQWVASGERLLSFTSTFTSDVNVLEVPDAIKEPNRRNIDVRAAVLWLRRFMLPRYTSTDQQGFGSVHRTFAPRKVRLYIPNSGIGLAGGGNSTSDISEDAITAVMTQCEVTYQSWFPNGLPQIAEIQLAFAEVPQLGGRVYFPSASQDLDDLVAEGDGADEFFAYGINPRVKPPA